VVCRKGPLYFWRIHQQMAGSSNTLTAGNRPRRAMLSTGTLRASRKCTTPASGTRTMTWGRQEPAHLSAAVAALAVVAVDHPGRLGTGLSVVCEETRLIETVQLWAVMYHRAEMYLLHVFLNVRSTIAGLSELTTVCHMNVLDLWNFSRSLATSRPDCTSAAARCRASTKR
jgi:hypothetical protein